MQCPRQWRRFHHRNAVTGGQFPYLVGHQVHPLGHHLRCAHPVPLVFQGNGEVRRVGDHHVGLGHLRHHPAARHLALLTADTRLQLGIAFHFLVFLPDLLLGHAQAPVVAPQLVWDIDGRDRGQAGDQRQRGVDQHLAERRQRRVDRLDDQGEQLALLAGHHPIDHTADQHRLQYGLDQLADAVQREHPLHTLQRIEPLEPRRQRLEREQPAVQHEGCRHSRHHRQQEYWRPQEQSIPGQGAKGVGQRGRTEGGIAAEREAATKDAAGLVGQPAAKRPETANRGRHDQERHQFAGLRHLPVFAGLFQASRRWWFGSLEIALFSQGRYPPWRQLLPPWSRPMSRIRAGFDGVFGPVRPGHVIARRRRRAAGRRNAARRDYRRAPRATP